MFNKSHKVATRRALEILAEMVGQVFVATEIDAELIIRNSGETDYLTDLEFVDVEAGRNANPHRDTGIADEAHKIAENGDSLTAYNHFIDIRKGSGQFDDFDGYSYFRGSANTYQFQDLTELVDVWYAWLYSYAEGFKVDQGISNWYEDEYVHIPGDGGYNNCSLAVERYSFYQDKGRYGSRGEELTARFPKASCWGGDGEGIPYSVFMPVDNLARYWYGEFLTTLEPQYLGHVMHAIQDASIPHHSAGCLGNWHKEYEDDLDADARIKAWVEQDNFESGVRRLVDTWTPTDPNPPNHLRVQDAGRRPAINWRIDQLVTWMALNSYQEYKNTYDNFRNGYTLNEQSMKDLTQKAVAMSVLVLRKATAATENTLYYVGDKRRNVLHKNNCWLVPPIPEGQREKFTTIGDGENAGYNLYCLRCLNSLCHSEISYIGDKRRKVLHKSDCWVATSIPLAKRETFAKVTDGQNAGYHVCYHCLKEFFHFVDHWHRDYYIGNTNSGEIHLPECPWVEKMSKQHIEEEWNLIDALDRRFNGCYYCMKEIDFG